MREMKEDEKKVFEQKLDYISKLKDSMTQEELDGILPKDVTEKMDAPKFDFGNVRYYPRADFNEYLEAAFTGSPVNARIAELEAKVKDLEAQLSAAGAESDGYVAEIEQLETELKEVKALAYSRGDDPYDSEFRQFKNGGLSTYYMGEDLMVVASALNEWLQNRKPQMASENLRCYELGKIYRDALATEDIYMKAKEKSDAFRKKLEKAVDKTFESNPTDITPLLSIGFTDRTKKGAPHWKLAWHDRDDYTFILAKTPSDRNGAENCKRVMTQRLCI